MSNSFYNHSIFPTPNAPGSSAQMRNELDLIAAGFNKMPTLAGNGYKLVMVNSAGTALVAVTGVQGLAITGSTINSTPIGNTTPSTGAFTTLSASGAASLGTSVTIGGGAVDATVIGATTRAAGNFTTLSATGAVSLGSSVTIAGGTINDTQIGNVTPSSAAFTTVAASSGFTGNLTGNVTGSVTGNVTGDVSGDLTGNVTASSGTSTFNNVTINGTLDMSSGTAGTITGLATPTGNTDAATKGYVDTQDAQRLALAGGTMSGAIAMGGNKITGVGDPTSAQDAATKAYVDSVAQGLDPKQSVRAATTADITLSGAQTIDGVAVIAGDRVLVKNQSTASQNGVYVAAAGSWTRSADMDAWTELPGAFFFVEEGTANDNSGWVCTVNAGGTLGTTSVTFEQFSGAGQIDAGAGMTKSGNQLNVGTASASRIVVNANDIDLATTGVVADTYRSVTVDAYGRVTAGTNPTTLIGYGITDAYTKAEADTLLGAKLSLAGGAMTGALAMGANKITGLADPTNSQDAVTLVYLTTLFGSTASAAASASAASISEINAGNSATSASGSASAAASSATSAAASFDSFDDRYLGAKSSDPTVDNDGNALLTGALYWNSSSNVMKVYDGSAWIAAYLPASGYAQLAATNTFTANQIISANSSSAALSITQSGSGNALYIEDVAADATPFVVSSTGAVGIGTTTPDNVTSAGIALVSNDGYYPQVVNRNKANDSTASYLVFDKDRAGAIVQNGDALGAVVWRSFDGANYLQSAAIIGYSDGAPGTNDVPGRLAFFTTADGASAPTERLSISSTGAWGFAGANYGTSGQVLTSGGSGAAPTWGSIAGGDATRNIGYLNIPQNSQSAAYTLVAADAGKHILHPSTDANARTFTIPANSSVAYPIGTAITFVNMTSQVVTIAITSDTLTLSPAGTSGSRSLAQYGSATALKIGSTQWLISGSGLT